MAKRTAGRKTWSLGILVLGAACVSPAIDSSEEAKKQDEKLLSQARREVSINRDSARIIPDRWALFRFGKGIGALKFENVHPVKHPRDMWNGRADYVCYFDEAGFLENLFQRKPKRGKVSDLPPTGVPGLTHGWNPGDTLIRCGSAEMIYGYPSFVFFSVGDHLEKHIVEIAPTAFKNENDILPAREHLTWFRYDSERKSDMVIPLENLQGAN